MNESIREKEKPVVKQYLWYDSIYVKTRKQ